MKTLRLFFSGTFLFTILLITGCDHFQDYDNTPPSEPRNISTVTGDERVDIYWDMNPERDVAGYNVYYSYSYDGEYTLIGSTENTHFIDDGAKNATTYYYAVSAYDYDGNESDLSEDVVYDTPRPEGSNQAIFDYNQSPNNAGYDFSEYLVLSYNDINADMFFENYNGAFYLNVWADDFDLQDMGQTQDIWDISYAPSGGWIPVKEGENVKYTQAIVGHTYVIWTWDNHFAKVRIKNITNERMVFDWAYQLVEGNRELKRGNLSSKRNSVPNKVERKY